MAKQLSSNFHRRRHRGAEKGGKIEVKYRCYSPHVSNIMQASAANTKVFAQAEVDADMNKMNGSEANLDLGYCFVNGSL